MRKSGVTYLIAFVLLAGIIFLMPNGIEPREQRITGFTLSMLIAAGVYIAFRLDIALGALILYVSFISLQMAYFDPQFYYMLFALIIFLIWIVQTEGVKKEILYDLLIAVACLNLLFQILQIFKIYFVIVPHIQTPGLMSNINETSALYAMVAPAFFRKKRYLLLPVIIAGLIISHSYQGVVAFAVVSTIWAFRNLPIKKALTSVVVVIALTVCFGIFVKPFEYKNYKSQRVYSLIQNLEMTFIKPVLGWGFNQYRFVAPLITSWDKLTSQDRAILYNQIADKQAFDKALNKLGYEGHFAELYDKAHNEYIEWLFVGGFAGLLIGLIFLGRLLWQALGQYDSIPFYGLLSASIVCMFGFSWHLMPLVLITVLYIALIEREKQQKNKNRQEEEEGETHGYCSCNSY